MGASVEIECPVKGCAYRATFRLSMGGETKGTAPQVTFLREEHPNHPAEGGEDQTGEGLATTRYPE